MADSEIESVQEENIEESDIDESNVQEKTEEIIIPEKTVKPRKISKKQQRLNAIDDFKNGKSNKDFKVYPLKNGSFRVVKRENATVKNEEKVETKPEIMPVINQQYTNDQFLINHILELEKKFEKLRLKQKKLKKSHKKLKSDIYDDDSEPIDLNAISNEVDVKNEEVVNEQTKIVEKPAVEPQPVRYNKSRKLSWRDMLNQ